MNDILTGRMMTVRRVNGRRIRRSVTAAHRDDDGGVEFTIEDEEIDDAAPAAAHSAAPEPVKRAAFEATMGDPNFRWMP
jgi:hypothetical protein